MQAFTHSLIASFVDSCVLNRPQAHGDIDLLFKEAATVTGPLPHTHTHSKWCALLTTRITPSRTLSHTLSHTREGAMRVVSNITRVSPCRI